MQRRILFSKVAAIALLFGIIELESAFAQTVVEKVYRRPSESDIAWMFSGGKTSDAPVRLSKLVSCNGLRNPACSCPICSPFFSDISDESERFAVTAPQPPILIQPTTPKESPILQVSHVEESTETIENEAAAPTEPKRISAARSIRRVSVQETVEPYISTTATTAPLPAKPLTTTPVAAPPKELPVEAFPKKEAAVSPMVFSPTSTGAACSCSECRVRKAPLCNICCCSTTACSCNKSAKHVKTTKCDGDDSPLSSLFSKDLFRWSKTSKQGCTVQACSEPEDHEISCKSGSSLQKPFRFFDRWATE